MTTLTGRAPKDSYKDLLQVSNSNSGVDATLRSIEDGEATATLIKVSTTATQLGAATLVDSSENEVIKTAGVASAVNEVTITNAATGGSPIISATGGDSVVGLDFATKNGGVARVNSSAILLANGQAVIGETVTVLHRVMKWGNATGTSALNTGWSINTIDVMTAGGALNMAGFDIGSIGAMTAASVTAVSISTDTITVGGAALIGQATLDDELLYALGRAVAAS